MQERQEYGLKPGTQVILFIAALLVAAWNWHAIASAIVSAFITE